MDTQKQALALGKSLIDRGYRPLAAANAVLALHPGANVGALANYQPHRSGWKANNGAAHNAFGDEEPVFDLR